MIINNCLLLEIRINVEMIIDEQNNFITYEEIKESVPILPRIPIKDAVIAFETSHKFFE